jgi:hypothetical protein
MCFQKGFGLYQNIDETSAQKSLIHEVKLQPDDLLLIIVSEDPEIAAPLI